MKFDNFYNLILEYSNLPPGYENFSIMSIDEYKKKCNQTEDEENNKFDPTQGAKYVQNYDIQDALKRKKQSEVFSKDKPGPIVPVKKGEDVSEKQFKERIKQRPPSLLSSPQKMQKTGGENIVYYAVSMPALMGFMVDEKTNELKVVQTCPSAGKCKFECFALKGNYQYPSTSIRQHQRLNYLMNDWNGFREQLLAEINKAYYTNKASKYKTGIRWHDAGDFFSDGYINIAFDVANKTPDVEHYAYTKEFLKLSNRPDKPKNFRFTFSLEGKYDKLLLRALQNVNFRYSQIVPYDLFKDLLKSKKGEKWNFTPDDVSELKRRIIEKYGQTLNLNNQNVFTYGEMMKMPNNPERRINVIVSANDGDEPASERDDVDGIYLLEH